MSKRDPNLLIEDIIESAEIVHHYFGIDYSIVWKIKETYLPELLNKLKKLKT